MKQDTPTLEKVLEEGKVFKTRYKTKSKSKTFPVATSMIEITSYLWMALEYGRADHINKTSHKYLITITKIEDGQ